MNRKIAIALSIWLFWSFTILSVALVNIFTQNPTESLIISVWSLASEGFHLLVTLLIVLLWFCRKPGTNTGLVGFIAIFLDFCILISDPITLYQIREHGGFDLNILEWSLLGLLSGRVVLLVIGSFCLWLIVQCFRRCRRRACDPAIHSDIESNVPLLSENSVSDTEITVDDNEDAQEEEPIDIVSGEETPTEWDLLQIKMQAKDIQPVDRYSFVTTLKHLVNQEWQTCVVCLDDFTETEQMRALPCGHVFHRECLGQWFRKKLICPICSAPVTL